jgi:hypothetical protein
MVAVMLATVLPTLIVFEVMFKFFSLSVPDRRFASVFDIADVIAPVVLVAAPTMFETVAAFACFSIFDKSTVDQLLHADTIF